MKHVKLTSDREMPTEDRQFYFGLAAASLLSLAIAVLAVEII